MKVEDMIGLKGLVNETGFRMWGHEVEIGEEFIVTARERDGERAECLFEHRTDLHYGNDILINRGPVLRNKYFLAVGQFELKEEYQENRTYGR